MLDRAKEDGLGPRAYRTAEARAAIAAGAAGSVPALAQAELLLSAAFADYVADLHRPAGEIVFVDRALAPPAPDPEALLARAASASSLSRFVAEARRMNPVYEALRESLRGELAARGESARARTIALNLARVRALPGDGRRFVLVDTSGARLWMFERGRAVGTMKVVVGKPDMATPSLAAFIRFAVHNPYWNIPPDLVRDRVAPRMLGGDLDYVARQRLEILSDFSAAARPLDPMQVDWAAVERGTALPHLRQLPGADNMMGAVKFMLPNRLGIYLHDTPMRGLFRLADRRRSSGCVRVEEAGRLERWLFRGAVPEQDGSAEQRVDLPEPVPVYLLYLTAVPRGDAVVLQGDPYGRDRLATRRADAGARDRA